MLDWMLPENHEIAILKNDHDTVKALFDDFEKADNQAAREKIIGQAAVRALITSAHLLHVNPRGARIDPARRVSEDTVIVPRWR
jgi:hypothetical protein